MQKIISHLWFDTQAEEAVQFYTSIFKSSHIGEITRYTDAGVDIHQRPPGLVMTIAFELNGQQFLALNGGSHFKFNESVSFMLPCDSQEEIDYYWEKLSKGGDRKAQQCGWLKDKYGLSWQIVPAILQDLMKQPEKSSRVLTKMLQMKKLDIAELRAA